MSAYPLPMQPGLLPCPALSCPVLPCPALSCPGTHSLTHSHTRAFPDSHPHSRTHALAQSLRVDPRSVTHAQSPTLSGPTHSLSHSRSVTHAHVTSFWLKVEAETGALRLLKLSSPTFFWLRGFAELSGNPEQPTVFNNLQCSPTLTFSLSLSAQTTETLQDERHR